MTKLLHRLGFHGPNWRPFWSYGNVAIECSVCGAQRQLSFDNASEIPASMIASGPLFGNPAVTTNV